MDSVYKKLKHDYNDIKNDIVVGGPHYFLVAEFVHDVVCGEKKQSISILDAGCGNGYLLNAIQAKLGEGQAKYFGFDISDEMVENSKKCNSDIDHRVCNLPDTTYKDGEFDLITLSEVLEHLYQPLASLKELRRILKDDGHLIITVPNGDRVFIDKVMSSKKKFQPADDVLFTYSELNYLFRKAGYRIVRLQSYGGLFPELKQHSIFKRVLYRILSKLLKHHPVYNLHQKQMIFVLKKDDYLLGMDY